MYSIIDTPCYAADGGASCVTATGAVGRCVEPASCAGVTDQRYVRFCTVLRESCRAEEFLCLLLRNHLTEPILISESETIPANRNPELAVQWRPSRPSTTTSSVQERVNLLDPNHHSNHPNISPGSQSRAGPDRD
ncbi:hypothetical protein EVAR_18587_1 [Eumeta japonica]|uniref:Uncharacterized protein n=1 Tax=Eumeta variegata TaxID=151549 RepID=A0A4C1V4B4_EUMVA|nr:hypothetical protein EVAR_18587_1 [Eumeta japonica]